MFNSLAFLYVTQSSPCCFAYSGKKSLSMNTEQKQELPMKFFLFARSNHNLFLKRYRPEIGRGCGVRKASSLDSVKSSLFAAFWRTVIFGFPVRCVAWNIMFSGSAPSSVYTQTLFIALSWILKDSVETKILSA